MNIGGRRLVGALGRLNPTGPSGWLVPVDTATNRAGRGISVSGTPTGIVFAR